jgi:hypothetical protein
MSTKAFDFILDLFIHKMQVDTKFGLDEIGIFGLFVDLLFIRC